MAEDLATARGFAEQIRFSGDTLRHKSDGDTSRTEAIASVFFQNELEITKTVTPALSVKLDAVCEHLRISPRHIVAFVYASSEFQADCFAASTSKCVMRFSSALVDLLDAEEFAFVCGHELGHFLLGHGVARMETQHQGIEFFMQQRAQEISVDRIGLVACGSLDVSLRALMKTASGLNSEHLRFDVGTFIAQLRKSSHITRHGEQNESHPSILVRCRALLWFSLNEFFTDGKKDFSIKQLEELDHRIQDDLTKYVDGPARRQIKNAKEDLAMWMAAYEVVQNGVFEKTEQAAFAKMFGKDTLERLISFLKEIPASDVQDTVFERVKNTREALEGIIPSSFESELKEIQERISASLN